MTREQSNIRPAARAGGAAARVLAAACARRLGPLLLTGLLLDCGFSTRVTSTGTDAGGPAFGFDALAPRADLITSDGLHAGGGADAECARQSATAQQLPLDLYVMMDSSGSMLDATATGVTKWDAVRSALIAFFNDPQSAGIGVGLQYFPQLQPNVPPQCLADTECGAFGPCSRLRTCSGSTTLVACTQNSECPRNQTCELVGVCALSGGACAPIGQLCGIGDPCSTFPGYCGARDSCAVAPYATPSVAIATLPASAAGLIGSLNLHEPDGLTPTAPAIAGAIQAAQRRATAFPGHKVAVVLVTDGFPSECVPSDIPGVAAIVATGAAGAPNATPALPAIPTFVIGVFAPADAADATMNLNALAKGGGTTSAVVISTSQNVSQVLQTALNSIRTTAVACQYQIPPASGGAIDFAKVNVESTAAGGGAVTTVGYVGSKAGCDPVRGGWYYDVDPATGGTPTLISTCDATCTQFRATSVARVDIVLGCQTVTIL